MVKLWCSDHFIVLSNLFHILCIFMFGFLHRNLPWKASPLWEKKTYELSAKKALAVTHWSIIHSTRIDQILWHSLKQKCRHFDEIFITGCTESCQNDNLRCSQWLKFHQHFRFSVNTYIIRKFMYRCHVCQVLVLFYSYFKPICVVLYHNSKQKECISISPIPDEI